MHHHRWVQPWIVTMAISFAVMAGCSRSTDVEAETGGQAKDEHSLLSATDEYPVYESLPDLLHASETIVVAKAGTVSRLDAASSGAASQFAVYEQPLEVTDVIRGSIGGQEVVLLASAFDIDSDSVAPFLKSGNIVLDSYGLGLNPGQQYVLALKPAAIDPSWSTDPDTRYVTVVGRTAGVFAVESSEYLEPVDKLSVPYGALPNYVDEKAVDSINALMQERSPVAGAEGLSIEDLRALAANPVNQYDVLSKPDGEG